MLLATRTKPHQHSFRLAWLSATATKPAEWFGLCDCGDQVHFEQPTYWTPPYIAPYRWWPTTSPYWSTTSSTSNGSVTIGNEVRCTCPPDRGDSYVGTCPIHDGHITYTSFT